MYQSMERRPVTKMPLVLGAQERTQRGNALPQTCHDVLVVDLCRNGFVRRHSDQLWLRERPGLPEALVSEMLHTTKTPKD
jgi:hypothetical protein